MSVIAKFLLWINSFFDENKKRENRIMMDADITPGL
jgi:hypothetical protein